MLHKDFYCFKLAKLFTTLINFCHLFQIRFWKKLFKFWMAPSSMSPGPAPRKMNPSIRLKSSLFALATLTKREVVMSIMPNRKTPFSCYNRQNSTRAQQTQLVALAAKTVETEAEKIAHPIFPANFLLWVLIRGNCLAYLDVYNLNTLLIFTRHSSSKEESQDSEESEENDKNSRENYKKQIEDLAHSDFKLVRTYV